MNNYKVQAKLELINNMMNPILSSLEEVNANKKALFQLHLSLEELFSNIINYAYDNNEGVVDISYEILDDKKYVRIIIKDKGKAFNPLEIDDPKLTGSANERQIGGLGIYIVKKSVDDIKYQRLNDENILEIVKYY